MSRLLFLFVSQGEFIDSNRFPVLGKQRFCAELSEYSALRVQIRISPFWLGMVLKFQTFLQRRRL
jgi:hypothetical protein